MSRRKLIPLSFGGTGLSTVGGRHAFFDLADGAFASPQYSPMTVARNDDFPSLARMQPNAKTLPLNLTIISCDVEGQFREITRILDPEVGVQILLAQDGNDIVKRLSCAPQQFVLPVDHDKPVKVPLFAPNPIWEADVQSSASDTIIPATNPITLAASNIGSFDALPIIEITPQTAKFATEGYEQMSEIAYVNRSEFPLTGPASGTWLLELTGGWDTAAIIDIAAITSVCTTTITAAQAMPFDITVGATAGFDTEGLLMVRPGGSEEQFAYTIKNATEFTLTARAKGGTSAVLHTQPFSVDQSRMQKDGRDIAVFLDKVKIDDAKVTVDGIDTATTKVWIELADAPAVSATLAEDANGVALWTMTFVEAHPFQLLEHVIFETDGGAVVVAIVLSTTSTTITASLDRNSAAMALTSAGAVVYKVLRHIQLAWNFTEATARPTNPDPPLINTDTSTNLLWNWNTAPIWADENQRPGGWSRILYSGRADVPELQKNKLAVKTALDVTGTAIRFTDTEPSADKPNFDAVEFRSPLGIDDVAGAIEYDASLGYPFALQVIGRDLLGLEEVIATKFGHDAGAANPAVGVSGHDFPVVYANEQETPSDILQAVVLRMRNMIATGIDLRGAVSDEPLATPAGTDGQDAQSFVLDNDTPIAGIATKVKQDPVVTIIDFLVAKQAASGVPGAQVSPSFDALAADLAITYKIICGGPNPEDGSAVPPFALPAGGYQLELIGSTTSDVERVVLSQYSRGNHWEIVSGVWTEVENEDLWFAILSYLVDNQEEILLGARTEEVATVDDITTVFDPDRTPFATMRAAETAYHIDSTFTRGSDSFRIELLRRWAVADRAVVFIDVTNRSVEMELSLALPNILIDVRQVLDEETAEPWVFFPAGASTLSIEAAEGAQEEDYTVRYRSAWLA